MHKGIIQCTNFLLAFLLQEMASNGHNDITRDDDDEREIILSDVPVSILPDVKYIP